MDDSLFFTVTVVVFCIILCDQMANVALYAASALLVVAITAGRALSSGLTATQRARRSAPSCWRQAIGHHGTTALVALMTGSRPSRARGPRPTTRRAAAAVHS